MRLIKYAKLSGAANTLIIYAYRLQTNNDDDKNPRSGVSTQGVVVGG